MKKYGKKLFAMVLALVLLVGIMPINAFAATTVDNGSFSGGLKWSINSDGVLTISGKGAMNDFDEDMPPWFPYAGNITSIVIQDGVKSIGNFAFALCSVATKVTIPNSVTSIGDYAFTLCVSLENTTFSSNLKSIGDYAFSFCVSLEGITLPTSLQYIGEGGFQGCTSITAVNIPANLETIGFCAFAECYSLADFTVNPYNPNYSIGGKEVLFNKDKSVLLVAPASLEGNYTVPNTVKAIDSFAFTNCLSVESINIPANVTAIGLCAFLGTDSITAINVDSANEFYSSDTNGVLFNKDKSTLIYMPAGLTGSYTIPDSVQLIEAYSFSISKGLTEVIIPDSVTDIGYFAFESSDITTVTVSDSVTYIGDGTFANCQKLESVYFEGDAPEIGVDVPVFDETTTTVYYPEGNKTWTSSVRESFGGDITWVAYTPEDAGIKGDVNGDGKLSNSDLVRLARYLIDMYEEGSEEAILISDLGDMNDDGRVSNSDLVIMARALLAD